jgi:hypothetical protein
LTELSDEEKEKLKNIEEIVWSRLHEKGKPIKQLEEEKGALPGDPEQEEFRTQHIWHNKDELDIFVAKKLNINLEKLDENSYKIFYQRVVDQITNLRDSKIIIDWKFGRPRYGVWRINQEPEVQNVSLKDLISKGLTKKHIQVLEKFHIFKRRIIEDSSEIRGIKGEAPIPSDSIVDEPHYLHNLVRGVYKPSGDEYALSIQTNPNSKWGIEINFDDENWKINYDFEDDKKYASDIESLKKCFENNIPIGIIYKHKKGVNEILGLGKITNHKGTLFEIVNFDPVNEQELEHKGEEYALSEFQNGDYSCPSLKSSAIRRIKQEEFRKELLKEYDYKCIFCGLGKENYLRGAHIVPFAVMQKNEPENSMNPVNGLLLCVLCDIAFEKGDIIVDEQYQIISNEKLKELSETDTAIKSWISNIKDDLEIKTSAKFKPDIKYLKWKIELV